MSLKSALVRINFRPASASNIWLKLEFFAGKQFTLQEFQWNFIWAHKFEAESTSSGWIGIDIKLSEAFTEPMSLVIWIINPTAITIDHFQQIEKINL